MGRWRGRKGVATEGWRRISEATVNHRGNTVVVAASCCKLVLFATAAAAVWQLAAVWQMAH